MKKETTIQWSADYEQLYPKMEGESSILALRGRLVLLGNIGSLEPGQQQLMLLVRVRAHFVHAQK